MKVTDKKMVWVVWQNTDLTEGRGKEYPMCICDLKETAERKSYKQGVQGSNANITEVKAYQIGHVWYGPCNIIKGNQKDIENNNANNIKNLIIEKALKLGLTQEEIDNLSG